MRRLVLASASPRRRELLAQAGYTFEVQPAHVNEDLRPGEDPIAYVVRLAREKAQSVLAEMSSKGPALPHVVVLGADTTVTSTATFSPNPRTPPMRRACCGCSQAARIA